MKLGLTVTKDDTAKLLKSIAALAGREVLVGVEDPAEVVIAYVQNYGSPAQNIPATHFIDRGIESAQSAISQSLATASLASMDGDQKKVEQALNAVGKAAVHSIQAVTPVRTGKLRSSITYKVTGSGGSQQTKEQEEIDQERKRYEGEESAEDESLSETGEAFEDAGEAVEGAGEAAEGIAEGVVEAAEVVGEGLAEAGGALLFL